MASFDDLLEEPSARSRGISRARFQVAIESYLHHYAAGSSHTARAKRADLMLFLGFLRQLRRKKSSADLSLSDWDYISVQQFVESRLSRGEAPTSVARRLATLKHLGRVLAERFSGFVNPAREVRAPKVPTPRPQGLSPDELSRIREKAKARIKERPSFTRFRNQVLFDFLLDTGLRADEVRLLRMSQLEDDLEWIRNVRTKGKRYRNVYITSGMRSLLREYLKARSDVLKTFYPKLTATIDASLPLFISTYNASAADPESFLMGAKSVWRAIKELSAKTPLHPHALRHSYALDLLEESNDVRLVAQALGHSDVRVTMRYTERVDQEIAKSLERSRRRKRGGAK